MIFGLFLVWASITACLVGLVIRLSRMEDSLRRIEDTLDCMCAQAKKNRT